MTPNFELQWARERVGLTQKAAADLIGVSRETFSRWESGKQPTPEKKFKRFLEAAGVDSASIPSPRKYGADGFPVGYTKANTGDTEIDLYDDERRLKALEGDEYWARERVRYEYWSRAFAATFDITEAEREKMVASDMEAFDARLNKASVSDLI